MSDLILSALLEDEHCCFFVFDKKGSIKQASKGFSTAFGVSATSEIVGKNATSLFPILSSYCGGKRRKGGAGQVQSYALDSSIKGSLFIKPLKNDDCLGILEHSTSISHSVNVTGNSSNSATFAETLSDAAVITDFFGTVIACNGAAESMFGYSSLDMENMSINDLVTGGWEAASTLRFQQNVELEGRNRDLGTVSLYVTFFPQPGNIIIVCRKRSVRRSLVSSSDEVTFFNELFYKHLSPALFFYEDCRISRANATCEKLLCYNTVSIVNKHLNEFFPGLTSKHSILKEQSGGLVVSRFEGKRVDGVRFYADLRVVSLKDKEYVMELHDITEYVVLGSDKDLKEKTLNSVLDTVADGILTINPDGIVQSFNAAAESIFGYASDEVVGKNVKMLMPNPYMENHDRFLKTYLQSHKPKILGIGRDVEGLRKDGTTFPIHLNVSEILTDYCHLFTGIIRDNSETKRLQNDGIMEAKKLNAVLNATVDGIILIDSAGLIKSMNPAAEKLFGYPLSSVKNKNISNLMPEPYRTRHDRYMNAYLNSGVRRIIGIGREVSGQRADGTTFPMYLSVSEVKLEGVHLFTGICRDITQQKLAEAAVLKEKNKLQTILDLSADGIFTVNLKGIVESFNKAAEKMFGYTSADIIGKSVELLHIREGDREVNKFDSSLMEDDGSNKEYSAKHRSGRDFPIDLSISEVKTSDIHLYSAIVRDVSNLRVNLMLRTF